MKVLLVFTLFLFSFSSWSKVEKVNQCEFYSNYAEIFYNEKNKTDVEDVYNALMFIIGQSDGYLSLDVYEQDAFKKVIKDLGNQVYADNESSLNETKRKAIMYCEHNAREIARTQSERIKYCQKKGKSAELIMGSAKSNITEDSLFEQIMDLTSEEEKKSSEYKNTMLMIGDIYSLYRENPTIDSAKVGEMIYKDCLLSRE